MTEVERIENWTPHPVRIVDAAGDVVDEFRPVGVARAAQTDQPDGTIAGVPIVRTEFGQVIDLPEPLPGVYRIVSIITALAARASGRSTDDLLLTGGLVRGPDGAITGCRQLARVP